MSYFDDNEDYIIYGGARTGRPQPPRPWFTVSADDFDVVPDEDAPEAPAEAPPSLACLIEEVENQLAELPTPGSDEAVLYDVLKDALPYLQRLAAIDVEDLV